MNSLIKKLLILLLVVSAIDVSLATTSKQIDSNQFENKTQEQVLDIAKDINISLKQRKNALEYLAKSDLSKMSRELISLYNHVKIESINQYNGEISEKELSPELIGYIELFYSSCIALGKVKNADTIQFLLDQTDPKNWIDTFNKSSEKVLNSTDASDLFFRHYLFKGLLESAIDYPELFSIIESFSDDYLGKTKSNVESWLIEYKEKYYNKNPNKLPGNGYILLHPKTSRDAINFLIWRIQWYFESKHILPDTLYDLTIPNGGFCAFLPEDPQGKDSDIIQYKYIHSENKWTYILVSVGPNGSLDIDLNKLEIGLRSQQAKEIFKNDTDDIYEVLTYIDFIE